MKKINELLNFGIINFDKSAGPTSYSVSEFVKRQLKLKKTSHMGTLDPKVTGVLPITLGRACKLADYFIRHDKKYIGVLETHKDCDIEDLQKLIDKNFVGRIKQTPPHRSAVAQRERERTVYYWKLLEASAPLGVPQNTECRGKGRFFLFEAHVEGGTYIRKLCSDLGEMIGGAHMGELRRTEAGIFDEETIVDLFEFKSAVDKWKATLTNDEKSKVGADPGDIGALREMIIPAEDAIRKVLAVVEVDKSAVKSLYIGRPLLSTNVLETPKLKKDEVFAAFCGEVFIGVYRKSGERLVFARSEFVFN